MSMAPRRTEDEFLTELDRVRTYADRIEDNYRWAHNMGLRSNQGGDQVKLKQSHKAPGDSSEVETIVISKAKLRSTLRFALRHLRRITKQLDSMDDTLVRVTGGYPDEAGYRPQDVRFRTREDVEPWELRQAERAKARRLEKGEGWGNG